MPFSPPQKCAEIHKALSDTLRHELFESQLEKLYNINISEAHAKASQQYDWWAQVVEEIGEEGEPYGILQID